MFNSPCGYLSVRVGPMRSGKTDWLRSNATKFSDLGECVIYINSSLDDNESRGIAGGDGVNYTSHSSSSTKFSDNVTMQKSFKLEDIDVENYDVICIDEAQFFDDLYECTLKWFLTDNKHIFVSSLDGSFKQEPIGDVYKLMPLAQEFIKLSAVCQLCVTENRQTSLNMRFRHNKASHTMLKGASVNDDVIQPGCTSDYFSVCTYHLKNFDY